MPKNDGDTDQNLEPHEPATYLRCRGFEYLSFRVATTCKPFTYGLFDLFTGKVWSVHARI